MKLVWLHNRITVAMTYQGARSISPKDAQICFPRMYFLWSSWIPASISNKNRFFSFTKIPEVPQVPVVRSGKQEGADGSVLSVFAGSLDDGLDVLQCDFLF